MGEKSLEGFPENSLFIPVKGEILDWIFWAIGENTSEFSSHLPIVER